MNPATARFVPARREAVLSYGLRGQNAPVATALLDCLAQGLPVHASHQGIRPAGPQPAPWLFCQSSGSGGRVKTIRRSHGSWIASFEISRAAFGLSPRDRYAVLGQLGHSLALYATLEALHLGAGLLLLAGDSPHSQMRQLTDSAATVLYATPAQLRRLLMADAGPLHSLTHVFCGGGKLDPDCRAAMAALCPNAVIREFYGTSETSFITMADGATPEDSVGRAYPGVSLHLGPAGRIAVASPYLFDGYAEPDLPLPPREEGHLVTGDIGWLDGAGHLFLRGRESRMVLVADRNLFLEDVEAALATAGAGLCAALAVPDPRRGHSVLAVVEGHGDDTLAARLRRACREALGDHAAPRRIIFLPRLPVLASGKPDLASLARCFGAKA
ncbi:AMP-binding protein [Paracoccus kondratievae]|uniref:AMP-binding protein n=1 Tax=Paracoccus kondratievae TaxID=135740 RepID=UPI0012667C1B|nr:AMP-binding protein [Paracoccus kondratievae]QFQ87062.1 AMP-binding protein [Paracoccus kondratievae]